MFNIDDATKAKVIRYTKIAAYTAIVILGLATLAFMIFSLYANLYWLIGEGPMGAYAVMRAGVAQGLIALRAGFKRDVILDTVLGVFSLASVIIGTVGIMNNRASKK